MRRPLLIHADRTVGMDPIAVRTATLDGVYVERQVRQERVIEAVAELVRDRHSVSYQHELRMLRNMNDRINLIESNPDASDH